MGNDTDSTTRDRFQGNSVQHVNKYRRLNMYIATNIAKIKYTIHTSSFRVLYLSHIFFFILLLQLTNQTLKNIIISTLKSNDTTT